MDKCLLCQEEIATAFGWQEFFGMGKEKRICESCACKFSKISGDICNKCGRLLSDVPEEHRHKLTCSDCVQWEKDVEFKGVLTKNRSLYHYNDFMKEVLAQFKFRGDAVISTVFEWELRRFYHEIFQEKKWLLVPIPLSKERLYERGFNQSLLLAKLFQSDITEALSKHDSEKQSKKARSERLRQENHFFVPDKDVVKGRDILLVDDIYTTGMTIRMAARKLKEAGAAQIASFTLVRS